MRRRTGIKVQLMRPALLATTASLLFATALSAQQPVLKLTATSVNVSEPGNGVRIDVARWSTNQERDQLLVTMNPPAPAPVSEVPAPAAAGTAEPTRGGRGGRGGQGARGGAQGGTRGGARGRGGAAAAAADPIASFTAAIGKAPTIGYIWTNEVTGYAIKYASKISASDGSERVILATNRRIGANALSWTPATGTPTTYEFTLVEIRLPSAGIGEAKTSLTTNIAVDNEAKTIGLENYPSAPTLLSNVRRL
jgi:hypothetical protein